MKYLIVTLYVILRQSIKLRSVMYLNNWIRKYTAIIKDYVDTLNPELSDVWSLDEIYLNVKNTKKIGKGFHNWLWNIRPKD